jgi:outer membrane protein assembly factor BamD (BamD/ComL family)
MLAQLPLKLYKIGLLLCIVGAAISVPGQDQTCTQESFDQAETAYQMRGRSSELKFRAERELKKLVSCAAMPERYQAEEHLQVVQEELAESNFLIAKFYLEKSRLGKGGTAGARARLELIVERYPKYTRLYEVLLVLRELNMDDLILMSYSSPG